MNGIEVARDVARASCPPSRPPTHLRHESLPEEPPRDLELSWVLDIHGLDPAPVPGKAT
jgi:hypothetical protein